MTRRNPRAIVFALLFVAVVACDSPSNVPAHGDDCFTGLQSICVRDFVARPTASDDPLLALCLPYTTPGIVAFPDDGVYESTYHYDERGAIDDIATECGLDGAVHVVGEHDADGYISRRTVPIGDVPDVRYPVLWPVDQRTFHNGAGELVQEEIRTGIGDHQSWTVESIDGRVSYIRYDTGFPNVDWSYRYDGDRLATITSRSLPSGLEPASIASYTYDDAGHLQHVTHESPGTGGHREVAYVWDGDELRSATYQSFDENGQSGGVGTRTYTYDGGQIHEVETTATCTAPAPCDEYVPKLTTETWDYDEQGRPIHLVWEREPIE